MTEVDESSQDCTVSSTFYLLCFKMVEVGRAFISSVRHDCFDRGLQLIASLASVWLGRTRRTADPQVARSPHEACHGRIRLAGRVTRQCLKVGEGEVVFGFTLRHGSRSLALPSFILSTTADHYNNNYNYYFSVLTDFYQQYLTNTRYFKFIL